jgi:hypothetical protein
MWRCLAEDTASPVSALGVLLYLVDSGKQRDGASILSVSGGIDRQRRGGLYRLLVPTNEEPFRVAIRPTLTHIARQRPFFWEPTTNAYVVATIATHSVGAALHVAGGCWARLADLGAWLFSRRSLIVERALPRVHLGVTPGSRPADGYRAAEQVCRAPKQQGGTTCTAPGQQGLLTIDLLGLPQRIERRTDTGGVRPP